MLKPGLYKRKNSDYLEWGELKIKSGEIFLVIKDTDEDDSSICLSPNGTILYFTPFEGYCEKI